MGINVLEPRIFNKIAAGEVVERPASIIKELVENSVDAKATKINIEIENGGITKLRVVDNGCGIDYSDLEKAFLPHATSKISSEDDLVGIKTLGFRGEALASIGAVSEVRLISKTKDAETGGVIEISGGNLSSPTICGADKGTDITVSNLFFNVPARAKFLKKPKTEESEITNLIERFILANPCISIKYVVDGKIKYMSSGSGMVDAIYEIYGKEAVDNTIYLENDYGTLKVYGFIGKPSFTKPNKTYQTIILNNRYIQNQTIASAVHNAYGEILMKKQFPFYVLYVDIDYESVDVNVHPNKMEVRFENGGAIYSKIFESVNRAINNIDFTRTLSTPDTNENLSMPLPNLDSEIVIEKQTTKIDEAILHNAIIDTNKNVNVKIENLSESEKIISEENNKMQTVLSAIIINSESQSDEFRDGVTVGSSLFNQMQEEYEKNIAKAKKLNDAYQGEENKTEQQTFDVRNSSVEYKIVGVVFKTYIIIEYNGKVLFIDQHAGHERILYDKFMKEVEKSQDKLSQSLLFPYILDVNQLEYEYLSENVKDLVDLGFEIETFGENCFKVTAVPYMLAEMDLKNFFNDVLSDVKTIKIKTYDETVRNKFATLACKSAVKAGDSLSTGEIEFLVNEFAIQNTKLLCPHGRPIVVEVSRNEIEKWFKRIV